jgi:hypothetical protein
MSTAPAKRRARSIANDPCGLTLASSSWMSYPKTTASCFQASAVNFSRRYRGLILAAALAPRSNFRIAVCCRSARIRRSHDLTVNVDELCNR